MITSVRGMRDLLPPATLLWRETETRFAECCRLYGYGEIRTPIVERGELFARQLGEHSDIVEKEMYSFTDKLSSESLTLRPEATAPTLRAVVAGGLHRADLTRVFYGGPMFRRERPQKGRYRQFYQLGAEAVGAANPAVDAEQILLTARFWRQLEIGGRLQLDINNLGNGEERARHRQKLTRYFNRHRDELDAPARRRIDTNPLRIFDGKEKKTMDIAAAAPPLGDELGDESRRYADAVKEVLSAQGIAFCENPMLVRGLDYYNLTVYEWSLKDDPRRQNTLCGGGRYDSLAQQIGAPPLPGCGFAIGQDRLVELLMEKESGKELAAESAVDCYLMVEKSATVFADAVAEKIRDAGISVHRHAGGGNLSRQFKKARAAGAKIAVLVDAESEIVIRRLDAGRQNEGEKLEVSLRKLLAAEFAAQTADSQT